MGSTGILQFDDLSKDKLVLYKQDNIKNILPYSDCQPLQNEIQTFINDILKKTKSEIDFMHAEKVTKILDRIEYSAKKNGKLIYF